MILENLKKILANKKADNILYVRNLLKEKLQNYILYYIYNTVHYKNLIFTGGTCLRKVYNLPRLSEDLDFDYCDNFSIDQFSIDLEEYFQSKILYKNTEIKIAGNQRTLFIKFPKLLTELDLAKKRGDTELLFIRCDFAEEKYGIFDTEVNSLSTEDFSFFIKNYDLPTLFAHKITAFLNRDFFKGKSQTESFKGRDVFDIIWFLEKSRQNDFQLQPNWKRLSKVFPDKSKEDLIEAVINKAKKIQANKIHNNLAPFVENSQDINALSENFLAVIEGSMSKMKLNL